LNRDSNISLFLEVEILKLIKMTKTHSMFLNCGYVS
jgi:hypothetical protein